MTTDSLRDQRSKSRYVLELRYDPAVLAFDRRGRILDTVHSEFKSKMEHWRVRNVEVEMADDFDSPSKTIQVAHLRCSITYEDPGSRQEFIDDSHKFLRLLGEVFPEGLGTIKRMGFRSLCALTWKECANFEECYEIVKSTFLRADLPLSLSFTDCGVILQNDSTRIYVGPVRKEEDWVKSTFSRPEENVPDFGIGLDVDCYALNLLYEDVTRMQKAARDLQELALGVEAEIVAGLAE